MSAAANIDATNLDSPEGWKSYLRAPAAYVCEWDPFRPGPPPSRLRPAGSIHLESSRNYLSPSALSDEAWNADPILSAKWTRLAKSIRTYLSLATSDCDAQPLAPKTVDAALDVASWCESNGANPEWATNTVDDTILLKARFQNGKTFKFEIEDEGAIGVARWNADGSEAFFDATTEALDKLLQD